MWFVLLRGPEFGPPTWTFPACPTRCARRMRVYHAHSHLKYGTIWRSLTAATLPRAAAVVHDHSGKWSLARALHRSFPKLGERSFLAVHSFRCWHDGCAPRYSRHDLRHNAHRPLRATLQTRRQLRMHLENDLQS